MKYIICDKNDHRLEPIFCCKTQAMYLTSLKDVQEAIDDVNSERGGIIISGPNAGKRDTLEDIDPIVFKLVPIHIKHTIRSKA